MTYTAASETTLHDTCSALYKNLNMASLSKQIGNMKGRVYEELNSKTDRPVYEGIVMATAIFGATMPYFLLAPASGAAILYLLSQEEELPFNVRASLINLISMATLTNLGTLIAGLDCNVASSFGIAADAALFVLVKIAESEIFRFEEIDRENERLELMEKKMQ